MTDEQNTATAATSATEQATQQNTATPTYSVDDFKRNSLELFGVHSEVIDGALHGKGQEEFTVAEMKKLVNAFMKKTIDKEVNE